MSYCIKKNFTPKNLHRLGGICTFAETNQTHPMKTPDANRNYLIYSKIGGGNSLGLPSIGLDIQRSSVCHQHAGGRFSYVSASPCGERKEGAL